MLDLRPASNDCIGADLVALVVDLAVGRLAPARGIRIEPFVLEIALLLGDPFLQAEMRFDDEFGHVFLRFRSSRLSVVQQQRFGP